MAAEDGLEENPKVKTLAKLLREGRRDAFWYVMMWRRLVVHAGNAAGALPRNYTADDVAAFLDFSGDARRLVRAMKATGFIGYRKGRGFFYPGWKTTTTGSYVSKRDDERVRKAREREERRRTVQGPSADVQGQTADASADGPRTNHGQTDIKKESKGRGAPPPIPPPGGGGSLADARWEEIMKIAPTPQNREVCKRMLAEMSAEDWSLVQVGYGRLRETSLTLSKKIRRVLHWPTDMFLRKQAYLRFRPATRQSVTPKPPPREGDPSTVAAGLAELEATRTRADEFIVALLADPDVPEAEKAARRAAWTADPRNAGRPAPWEVKVKLRVVTAKT